MAQTSIQWTDSVWNPITGCTKVSQGCKHCYAETMAKRMWAQQYPPNSDGTARQFTDVRVHPDRLDQPLHWKKSRRVFVNSMSDLFHEDVPDEFICDVFTVMRKATIHTFQILTKRPERMLAFMKRLSWHASEFKVGWQAYLGDKTGFVPPNVWLGVSVEDQSNADKRIPILLQVPARTRFLSCEPLLGPLVFSDACNDWLEDGINWVIVGGESGKGARPFNINWARDIMRQCKEAVVPCFIKQLGAQAFLNNSVGMGLRDSHGGDMAEWPDDLKVREWPVANLVVA